MMTEDGLECDDQVRHALEAEALARALDMRYPKLHDHAQAKGKAWELVTELRDVAGRSLADWRMEVLRDA